MASGPITSWEIDGETVATVADFIFLGPKITADGDCSHEIKRCLLLGPWRRQWQPTPVLLPGKSHEPRSLVGYSPWGHKKSDMTERLHFTTPWKKSNNQPRQHIKKQRHFFVHKGPSSQGYVFPSSQVWM